MLAFLIWCWAVWGGVCVVWRGRKFWFGRDMKVHEILEERGERKGKGTANGNGGLRKTSCERVWEEHGGGWGRDVYEVKDRVKDD